MPPKRAAAATKENVSLGPLAGDGMCLQRNVLMRGVADQLNRQTRLRCGPYFRLLQRYLRPRYRSEVRRLLVSAV